MQSKHVLCFNNHGRSYGRRFGASKMHLSPMVAAVHSNAVVLLLLIHCFMYLTLFVEVLCFVFDLVCFT